MSWHEFFPRDDLPTSHVNHTCMCLPIAIATVILHTHRHDSSVHSDKDSSKDKAVEECLIRPFCGYQAPCDQMTE